MGKKKYQDAVEALFEQSPVVESGSVNRIVGSSYARNLLQNLERQGRIYRLTKGYYTKHSEVSLIVFCFSPSYLGLQDAMSFHGIWEQESNPVVITAKGARNGLRQTMGMNYVLHTINREYLFGYDLVKVGEFYLPYSDVEKTYIDMVYFNQSLDKQVLKEFLKRINKEKMSGYLKRYPKDFQRQVKIMTDF